MNTKRLLIVISALLLAVSAKAQITFGEAEKINDEWKFCLNPEADCSATSFDDSSWRVLDLPHDWSVEYPIDKSLASCTGYLPGGIGWYRKTLSVPKSLNKKKLFLYFEGVYCNSEVWVNGQFIGKRPNGYVSFIYDVTEYLRAGKENVIAVKVDHTESADSRWYTGSGIYRDVYLVSSENLHIDNWGVFARTLNVRKNEADLAVTVKVVNETGKDTHVRVVNRLLKNETLIASEVSEIDIPQGDKAAVDQIITVGNPILWSVDKPELYTLETTVYDSEGKKVDGTKTTTGIRTTRFDPDKGFFLNGKNMKMKGVCLHHDAGALGSVVPEDVWRRRLKTLKEIGCNAIRMSHNPQAEVLYDLCDEMGFLVMDEAFDEWEFPKRKWIEGWNVGKNPGYQGYSKYFNEWAEIDLASMIERDKNHPSIVLWSIGNEVDYPNDPYSHPILDYEGINQKTIPGYQPDRPRAERIGDIAEKLVKVARSIDTSRAVTGAMAGVVMSNHTRYPSLLDVTGYNYTEHRYIKDHFTYPERVIYGSENRHDYPAWLAVTENDHIFGQFLWTGIDYLGEAGRYPSRGFICGLMDLGGYKKPRGWYRQSLWSDKPMIYAGTILTSKVNNKTEFYDREAVWNYKDGDRVTVAVFTNCEEVRLSVNGKEIKGEPVRHKNSNALCWDVPYEKGELKVTGFNKGKPVAEHKIQSYGKVAALKIKADRQTLEGKGRIAHLSLEMNDARNIRVLNAHDTVICEVSGSCSLLQLENAQPDYQGSFEGNALPAYKGRILAYIQADAPEGKATVTFKVPSRNLEESIELDIKTSYDFDTEDIHSETYREDPELKLYFLYPDRKIKKNEKLPAMVFFFGGGWVNGSIHQFASQGRELADRGMAVVFADYRVWKKHGTDPFACVEDAKSAMRYLRQNAERLNIDPDRIAASGGSAGGHLAAATAYVKAFDSPEDDLAVSPVPNALVLFNPVFNNAPEPEGYGYDRIKSRFEEFSPYHNIGSNPPPTLILLGTKDHLIPVSTAQAFVDKAVSNGGKCELELYEDAGHGFFNKGDYHQITLDRMITFLESIGYIQK